MSTGVTSPLDDAASELVHFHLLGRTLAGRPDERPNLFPAVLAPFRDLGSLRHDYPLVLTEDEPFVHALSDLVDEALRRCAPRGMRGERLRRLALDIEADIRRNVADGRRGTLGARWEAAERQLIAASNDPDTTREQLAAVRGSLPTDGRLVDCDTDSPAEVVGHVWCQRRREAAQEVRTRIEELTLGLENVLRAEDAHTDAGRAPDRLRAGVGDVHRDAFDFDGWSAVLRTGPTGASMSESRRTRIGSAIEVLRAQQFFPHPEEEDRGSAFWFTSCATAAAAYVDRIPEMVQLVRAMAIAELELRNAYRPAIHDPVFERFDERSLTPDDLASFPSYFVCLADGDLNSAEQAQLLGILGSDVPINIVVGVRDVLGDPGGLPLTNGVAPSAIGRRLGTMTLGLGTAFVLQTVASNLVRVRDRIEAAVGSRRPTLVSVFTGSAEQAARLPSYLLTAMAMQSRAFPTFTFDPDAGTDWVDRFDLATNPDPAATWTAARVDFEDAEMQRRHDVVLTTPVDLAALDPRYGPHFTIAPPDSWSDDMEPVDEAISLGAPAGDKVPYVLMATEQGTLERVVVDRQLLHEIPQYAATWRSLQELAGIDNSHARTLLAAERARWEAERAAEPVDDEPEVGQQREPPAPEPDGDRSDAVSSPPADGEDDAAAPADGESYIETARCTTCDECTKLNPRMFAYDDNKQADIVDLTAGTYRQLVEAAEACQVAIIHPGEPWDPSEPNLDELVERAAAFR